MPVVRRAGRLSQEALPGREQLFLGGDGEADPGGQVCQVIGARGSDVRQRNVLVGKVVPRRPARNRMSSRSWHRFTEGIGCLGVGCRSTVGPDGIRRK